VVKAFIQETLVMKCPLACKDSYFFLLSEKKNNTVAPIPIKERAIAPDTKMPFFKIFFTLFLEPILNP